jgi:hypothetical protein
MIARLAKLELTTDDWRLRSCDSRLSPSGAATHVAIERMHPDGLCHVVAVIELGNEGPSLRTIGMRPFDEGYGEDFWAFAKLGCELVRGIQPASQAPGPTGEKR